MRLCEFSKKEVINVSDCKCLGCVCDLKFDEAMLLMHQIIFLYTLILL